MLIIAFVVGIIAARWLLAPLAALLRVLVFALSVAVAARIATALVPLDLDMRGFSAGAGIGLLFALTLGGLWFYILGWRGRADATMIDKIERAKQDNAKERKLV